MLVGVWRLEKQNIWLEEFQGERYTPAHLAPEIQYFTTQATSTNRLLGGEKKRVAGLFCIFH